MVQYGPVSVPYSNFLGLIFTLNILVYFLLVVISEYTLSYKHVKPEAWVSITVIPFVRSMVTNGFILPNS